MKTLVGVMGAGASRTLTEQHLEGAERIGRIIAEAGAVLLSGGMGGTMEAACEGARKAGGLVVGICPGDDPMDLNEFVDIPIVTNMGSGRNYINILSSRVVVALAWGMGPGTLSEVALTLKADRPMIVIGASDSLRATLEEVHFGDEPLLFFEDAGEAEADLRALIRIEQKELYD